MVWQRWLVQAVASASTRSLILTSYGEAHNRKGAPMAPLYMDVAFLWTTGKSFYHPPRPNSITGTVMLMIRKSSTSP